MEDIDLMSEIHAANSTVWVRRGYKPEWVPILKLL